MTASRHLIRATARSDSVVPLALVRRAWAAWALLLLGVVAACGSSRDDSGRERATSIPPSTDSTLATTSAPKSTTATTKPAVAYRVLVFTRTTDFRHASIVDGVQAVRDIAAAANLDVDATEDPAVFTDANLRPYAAVIFLSTTGDVLDGPGQAAFERFIGAGGGFVGIHSATDTEYDWEFYGRLVGAYFSNHPATQPAHIRVVDRDHVSTRTLPDPWARTDEWYNFRANPRPNVHVLLTIDETSYTGGTMGADHPIAWCHAIAGGRAWYTGLGHTDETFAEPLVRDHLRGGIEYAAGRAGGCD